jgi:hypothetical protein
MVRKPLFNPEGIVSFGLGLKLIFLMDAGFACPWVTRQNESATLKGLRHSIPSRIRVTKKYYLQLSCFIVFYRGPSVGFCPSELHLPTDIVACLRAWWQSGRTVFSVKSVPSVAKFILVPWLLGCSSFPIKNVVMPFLFVVNRPFRSLARKEGPLLTPTFSASPRHLSIPT